MTNALDLAQTAATEIATIPLDEPIRVRSVAYAAILAITDGTHAEAACRIIERAVEAWEGRLAGMETGPFVREDEEQTE